MKRELFIEAINAIEKQLEKDIEISKILGKVFTSAFEANLMPDNQLLSNALIKVLQEEMNDTKRKYGQSWIEWFCFETDFGKRSELKAYDENNKEIKMNNAGDLFDFLSSLKNN